MTKPKNPLACKKLTKLRKRVLENAYLLIGHHLYLNEEDLLWVVSQTNDMVELMNQRRDQTCGVKSKRG